MLYFYLFIFPFFFFYKSVSESCVCMSLYKCKSYELCSSKDFPSFNELNLWGHPCEDNYDVSCKIRCGQRQTENLPIGSLIRERILDANAVTNFAEFPWMLALLYEKIYECGASLIHPTIALTAAHCVQKSGLYTIRAGEWDWRSRKEPLKHQDRLSKKIITHSNYNPDSLVNDIALIIVNRPFQLTDNVGVVCLPPPNTVPFPDECIVTGWGKTSHKNIHTSNILNKAIFPIVANNKCENTLQEASLGPLFRLHESFICAGDGNKDTCKGDGGSPLVCGIRGAPNVFEQFGIVSWGLVCGVYGTPGVYVGVAKFVEWIDYQVTVNGFSHEFYKYRSD